jgi:hypothetical protein
MSLFDDSAPTRHGTRSNTATAQFTRESLVAQIESWRSWLNDDIVLMPQPIFVPPALYRVLVAQERYREWQRAAGARVPLKRRLREKAIMRRFAPDLEES